MLNSNKRTPPGPAVQGHPDDAGSAADLPSALL